MESKFFHSYGPVSIQEAVLRDYVTTSNQIFDAMKFACLEPKCKH